MKLKQILVGCLVLFLLAVAAGADDESLFSDVEKIAAGADSVNDQITEKYEEYLNSSALVNSLVEQLEPIEAKSETLRDQLAALDENIKITAENLRRTEGKIRGVQLKIVDLAELAEIREVELAAQKKLLDEFLRLAYAEAMRYTDWQTGKIDPLKFLLDGGSLAEAEQQKTYLEVLQKKATEFIESVQNKQAEYEAATAELLVEREKLLALQREISGRKRDLDAMRAGRQKILDETRGQEILYQKMIAESKSEEEAALAEIEELRSQLSILNQKILDSRDELGEEEFQKLLATQNLTTLNNLKFPNPARLLWPISPSRGLTAYFIDPEYKKIFGVEHHAVDIRASQQTPIRAAAPGIVARAADNGFGYSYVAIAHPGGLITRYGHVYKIEVEEGDVVQAGQEIGLSGGAPGTRGAGVRTTGPHLHFEVIADGELTDPLEFLPLEQLGEEWIPEEFLATATRISDAEKNPAEAGSGGF